MFSLGNLYFSWLKNFDKTPKKYFVKSNDLFMILNISKFRMVLYK